MAGTQPRTNEFYVRFFTMASGRHRHFPTVELVVAQLAPMARTSASSDPGKKPASSGSSRRFGQRSNGVPALALSHGAWSRRPARFHRRRAGTKTLRHRIDQFDQRPSMALDGSTMLSSCRSPCPCRSQPGRARSCRRRGARWQRPPFRPRFRSKPCRPWRSAFSGSLFRLPERASPYL